jgi:hypothetical protein
VRWRGRFTFAAGTYTFKARYNDGMQVWIDDRPIIDSYTFKSTTEERAVAVPLSAGEHTITVQYFEGPNAAVAQFWWES